MQVINYFYEVGEDKLSDRIGLLEDRKQYMTAQYSKRHRKPLNEISLDGRVGVFYVGGVGVHNSETRQYTGAYECSVDILNSGPVIKETHAYMMHKYIGILTANGNTVEYATISSNTCASSMHSIYEAEIMMQLGRIDYAVIIAEEKTSFNTIRIFSEHQIDVMPGEGFACLVLGNSEGGVQVKNAKWAYSYNSNPFLVSADGYAKVDTASDSVKGHKTGTEQNDTAEAEVFGETFGYKDKIGHCQGASGLIEVCIVLDDEDRQGKILCTASGLGGFYGSCIVEK